MSRFNLDTSGGVRLRPDNGGIRMNTLWGDLDAFTQGYVEAALSGPVEATTAQLVARGKEHDFARFGFSDLAPETLAAILKDCAAFQKPPSDWVVFDHNTGGDFWRDRQSGQLTRLSSQRFPPLTVSLGDDGKVYLS